MRTAGDEPARGSPYLVRYGCRVAVEGESSNGSPQNRENHNAGRAYLRTAVWSHETRAMNMKA